MKRTIGYICLLLLILLFVYAGTAKYLDMAGFRVDMRNQVFPDSWVPFIVYGLPALEILTALSLIWERTRMMGLFISLGLLLCFALYTALVILKVFDKKPCSCGGIISGLSWGQHMAFDLFFIVVTIIAINLCAYNRRSRKPEEKSRQHFNQ
jgi:hypothetical protein